LDECETLTEAAQLSLQTILNHDPKDICVILICNSQSRIHPKLRQRLLKVRYDPPNRNADATDMFTAITRGDLRQTPRKQEIDQRIWNYLHCHPSNMGTLIRDTNVDHQSILSEILLLADIFGVLDDALIERINIIYSLVADGTVLYDETDKQLVKLLTEFKQKFEEKFSAM
jgi:hypothetical protein